jgi:hypothetical protein
MVIRNHCFSWETKVASPTQDKNFFVLSFVGHQKSLLLHCFSWRAKVVSPTQDKNFVVLFVDGHQKSMFSWETKLASPTQDKNFFVLSFVGHHKSLFFLVFHGKQKLFHQLRARTLLFYLLMVIISHCFPGKQKLLR